MNLKIKTSYGDIKITLTEIGGRTAGSIAMPDALDEPSKDSALDAVTSMVLAHACAGVNVVSAAYAKGVQAALSAIENHR